MEDIRKFSQSLSNYSRIRDFVVKRKPFSIETGELTVTLKQKRKVIEENYRFWIDKMYE
jgi:long-chain acyl-CoA synthetase